MQVQWLRSAVNKGRNGKGRITGFALFFKKRGCILSVEDSGGKAWRICDLCRQNAAMLWCVAHAQYVCEACLPGHQGAWGSSCRVLMSVGTARERAGKMSVGWP